MDNTTLLDSIANTYYSGGDCQEKYQQHLKDGVTPKQLVSIIHKLETEGVPVPKFKDRRPKTRSKESTIIIESSLGTKNPNEVIDDLADKFARSIYGKSMVNCLGKPSTIMDKVYGKNIIIRVPTIFKSYLIGDTEKKQTFLEGKLLNSINHYRRIGKGTVTFEFYKI